jgi:hypothetical protein
MLPHQRHLIHLPVAGCASNAFVDVNTVIEIDKIGKIVHLRPCDRGPGAIARTNRFQIRARGPELRMAIHAGFGRRDTRVRGIFHRCMAVSAIDTNVTDVMLVTELHRLLARHPGLRDVRRTVDFVCNPSQERDDEHGTKDTELGYGVGARMENLRHLSTFTYRERQTGNWFELSNAEKPKDTLIL